MAAEQDVDKVVIENFFPLKKFFGFHIFQKKGVIVDVGAARPDYLSISQGFRSIGWQVIAVEPNPAFCKEHYELGYKVYEYACGDEDRDDVDFFVVDSHDSVYLGEKVSNESFSSLGIEGQFADLHAKVAEKTTVNKIKVDVRKLDTILSQYEPKIKHIDVLAVDVEGWELKVMDGFSVKKFNPKIIILENLFTDQKYVEKMRGFGYELWERLEPNDVYVRKLG